MTMGARPRKDDPRRTRHYLTFLRLDFLSYFLTLFHMRRNMKLIQAILLYLERQPYPWGDPPEILDEFKDAAIVSYHVDLCVEAGYVERNDRKVSPRRARLTWAGHEELDRIKV